MSGGDGERGPGLRLHIEHLRVEGMAPLRAEELAGDVEEHLARLVEMHGTPPLLAGGGALRLEAATLRAEPGWPRERLAAAVARQLYEQWYGPLGPWSGRDPGLAEERAMEPEEETPR